jgi:hypothetical protein
MAHAVPERREWNQPRRLLPCEEQSWKTDRKTLLTSPTSNRLAEGRWTKEEEKGNRPHSMRCWHTRAWLARTYCVCAHKGMAGPKTDEYSRSQWRQRRHPIPKQSRQDNVVQPGTISIWESSLGALEHGDTDLTVLPTARPDAQALHRRSGATKASAKRPRNRSQSCIERWYGSFGWAFEGG